MWYCRLCGETFGLFSQYEAKLKSESFQFCDIMMAFPFTNDALPCLTDCDFLCAIEHFAAEFWTGSESSSGSFSKKGHRMICQMDRAEMESSATMHLSVFTNQLIFWPLPMIKDFGWRPKESDYGFQQPKWGLSACWLGLGARRSRGPQR